MTTLKLIQFSGEIPRLIPRLLPDGGAQFAENVRLDDGGLTPIRKMRPVAGVDPGAVTIYKHGSDWLAWNAVVNPAPGPVAQDRLYYTGDGVPKMRVSGTVYDLKVPYPTAALTATLSGTGSGDVVTRIYCYTYVTDFGEESEPCPVSNEVDWQSGKTVTLSGFAAVPTGRGIAKQRIYRSQSSVSSGTDFFLIAERTASTANFTDTVAIDGFAEVLPSRDWNQPPDNLQGLIALPNGMMAGFVGKELCFCEPYFPHAWPQKYRMTMDYDIVALGAFGKTIVVATDGQPYVVAGTAPENMQQDKMERNLPCINARGMVDLGYSVAYPSHDGLVVVSNESADVATADLMTRNNWLKTSPATFVAGQFAGRYFASYEYLEANGTQRRGTFIFDLASGRPFILRGSAKAQACFYDIKDGVLYMLIDGVVYEWDALGEVNEIMTWKSKQFVYPAPATFGCILIEGIDEPSPEEKAAQEAERQAILAANAVVFAQPSIGGEIAGAAFNTYPVNGDAMQRVYSKKFTSVEIRASGEIVATVNKINQVVRLPAVPVSKAKNWEVQVNGTNEIAQITMATSPRELNAV